MYDGALIDGVIRIYNLGGGEAKEGIDGNENNADGISMDGTSPLKVMVRSNEEGRSDVSFPEGGEGAIIGLVNKGEVGMANLETSQKSIVPSGEIYIRLGYKGRREGIGGEGIGIAWGIRHTMDRLLVCQQESVLGDQRFKGRSLTEI